MYNTQVKSILFVKANSRLGLLNAPHRAVEPDIGVEDGPDAVLSEDFLKKYPNHKIISYVFPLPETITKADYASTVAKHSKELSELIANHLNSTNLLVTIGGDHSISFSSLLAVTQKYKDVGLIQFDSHADINAFASSPSGNFHGMWLRPFLGSFDNKEIESLITRKLSPQNLLYIGNLDLDPEEIRFIADHNIKIITRKILVEKPRQARDFLLGFLSTHEHIHLSFDIDVFDMSIAPATGIPRSGLFPKNVHPLLSLIATHPSLSIDLVEVNPKKEGAPQTIALAHQVLEKLLPHE